MPTDEEQPCQPSWWTGVQEAIQRRAEDEEARVRRLDAQVDMMAAHNPGPIEAMVDQDEEARTEAAFEEAGTEHAEVPEDHLRWPSFIEMAGDIVSDDLFSIQAGDIVDRAGLDPASENVRHAAINPDRTNRDRADLQMSQWIAQMVSSGMLNYEQGRNFLTRMSRMPGISEELAAGIFSPDGEEMEEVDMLPNCSLHDEGGCRKEKLP